MRLHPSCGYDPPVEGPRAPDSPWGRGVDCVYANTATIHIGICIGININININMNIAEDTIT